MVARLPASFSQFGCNTTTFDQACGGAHPSWVNFEIGAAVGQGKLVLPVYLRIGAPTRLRPSSLDSKASTRTT